MKTPEWNVYYQDVNGGKIETFNVFDHYSFAEEVKKHLKKCKTREELAEGLKLSAMCYFWSKCEWELILAPWIGKGDSIKVDVYDQLRLNWDVFVNYVWDLKRKANEKGTHNG